jgi:hypothetical protein
MATGATEFKFGDAIEGRLNGTATAGTMIRTESADPALLGTLSPGRVGLLEQVFDASRCAAGKR